MIHRAYRKRRDRVTSNIGIGLKTPDLCAGKIIRKEAEKERKIIIPSRGRTWRLTAWFGHVVLFLTFSTNVRINNAKCHITQW